jgi:hypothetical protein
MREIKFRAWDREAEYFRYWEYGDTKPYVHPAIERPQQFTGLRDKNGKEIYEGDVVRGLYVNDYGDKVQVKGLVEFSWGVFDLEWGGTSHYPLYQFMQREVIGNIYENPDLLSS